MSNTHADTRPDKTGKPILGAEKPILGAISHRKTNSLSKLHLAPGRHHREAPTAVPPEKTGKPILGAEKPSLGAIPHRKTDSLQNRIWPPADIIGKPRQQFPHPNTGTKNRETNSWSLRRKTDSLQNLYMHLAPCRHHREAPTASTQPPHWKKSGNRFLELRNQVSEESRTEKPTLCKIPEHHWEAPTETQDSQRNHFFPVFREKPKKTREPKKGTTRHPLGRGDPSST